MKKYKKYGYADMSWSPFSGCSAACSYCWARPFAHRLKGMGIPAYQYDDPFAPAFHPERLSEPEKWRKPQVVACNFMGDWMDAAFTLDQQLQIIHTAQNNERHVFLTLTKQPRNLLRHFNWFGNRYSLNNMWHGLTITSQQDADEKLPIFLQIPGKKWLSLEPCVSEIRLIDAQYNTLLNVDQVIMGGMSGPLATPMHLDWVCKVRDDCAAAGVPFFFKQWGEYLTEGTTFCGVPATLSSKVGKKAAGRMLDGREHNDLAWGETNG